MRDHLATLAHLTTALIARAAVLAWFGWGELVTLTRHTRGPLNPWTPEGTPR